MAIVIDIPGVGPTEFPDEQSAQNYFKNNMSQEQQLTNLSTKKPSGMVLDKINVGGINLTNLDSVAQKKEVQNTLAKKGKSESAILDKVDVKQILNEIRAINQAESILNDISKAKSKVNTGPYAGDFFDSSIRKFDKEGKEETPGFIDSVITSAFPGKTRKMRNLDQALSRLSDYIFTKGGKSLTGTEKGAVLGQFPGIYEDDPQFNRVLKNAVKNLSDLKNTNLQFLKKSGVDTKSFENFEEKIDYTKMTDQDILKMLNGK